VTLVPPSPELVAVPFCGELFLLQSAVIFSPPESIDVLSLYEIFIVISPTLLGSWSMGSLISPQIGLP